LKLQSALLLTNYFRE